jgi:hypothetical protein
LSRPVCHARNVSAERAPLCVPFGITSLPSPAIPRLISGSDRWARSNRRLTR